MNFLEFKSLIWMSESSRWRNVRYASVMMVNESHFKLATFRISERLAHNKYDEVDSKWRAIFSWIDHCWIGYVALWTS